MRSPCFAKDENHRQILIPASPTLPPFTYFIIPSIPPSSPLAAAAAASVNSIVMFIAYETHGSGRGRATGLRQIVPSRRPND